MKIISPIDFKKSFQSVARESEQDMLRCWTSGSQFTTLVRKQVLLNVARKLELEAYCEKDYYWLDAIFYEEKDNVHFAVDRVYAKYISVALEHENTPFAKGCDTAVEMNKLQLFNTPLKVLITYANGAKAKELLDKYARIMISADVFSDFTTQRKQLVIFGPPGNNPPARINWSYHVYEQGRFIQI